METKGRALCAVTLDASPFFRAVLTPYRDLGENGIAVSSDTARHLGLSVGTEVIALALD